ncbi:MAG TPA: nicotinate (nicotinamide) nucleotide adenylyltransferase [Tepidisphaeraceae bacterium]|nr:nicotinate (nicotinamide) nucleotide adenylyltransferase [Tepidisphaeraceae bacterium]
MPRLILGGSFNPIHHGHLICARCVAEQSGFGCVTLMPTAQPPHKAAPADLAPAGDRLAMARLAVLGDPLFEVDDLEILRPGPSYTIDTVRQIARGDSIHWLIGADMLLYLPHWHRIEELLREVNFVIMERPGWPIDWNLLSPLFQPLRRNVVTAPLIDIRATEIRRRCAAGLAIDYLAPAGVCRYIREHGLFVR